MDTATLISKYGPAGTASLGVALATVVVMCATPPRTGREWVIGLISTVVGSIAGGAYLIERYQLQSWTHTTTGLMSMLGLVFACGLPAWALVRWAFTWVERRRDADLGEIVDEVRGRLNRK